MTLFLPWDTWMRLVVWLVIGLFIYFMYGMRHSVQGQGALEAVPRTRAFPYGRAHRSREELEQPVGWTLLSGHSLGEFGREFACDAAEKSDPGRGSPHVSAAARPF